MMDQLDEKPASSSCKRTSEMAPTAMASCQFQLDANYAFWLIILGRYRLFSNFTPEGSDQGESDEPAGKPRFTEKHIDQLKSRFIHLIGFCKTHLTPTNQISFQIDSKYFFIIYELLLS